VFAVTGDRPAGLRVQHIDDHAGACRLGTRGADQGFLVAGLERALARRFLPLIDTHDGGRHQRLFLAHHFGQVGLGIVDHIAQAFGKQLLILGSLKAGIRVLYRQAVAEHALVGADDGFQRRLAFAQAVTGVLPQVQVSVVDGDQVG